MATLVFAANAMSANASPVMMEHTDPNGNLYAASMHHHRKDDGSCNDDNDDEGDDNNDDDDDVDEDDFRLPNFGKTARTASAAYASNNHNKVRKHQSSLNCYFKLADRLNPWG